MLNCASAARGWPGAARRNSSNPARAAFTEPRRRAPRAASYISCAFPSPPAGASAALSDAAAGGGALRAASAAASRARRASSSRVAICWRSCVSCCCPCPVSSWICTSCRSIATRRVETSPRRRTFWSVSESSSAWLRRSTSRRSCSWLARSCCICARRSWMSRCVARHPPRSGTASSTSAARLIALPARAVSCPPTMANSARRLRASALSSAPSSSGRSLPYDSVVKRDASIPYAPSHARTASARRWPSARLYSVEPRWSACPSMRSRTPGLARRISALARSFASASPRISSLSYSKKMISVSASRTGRGADSRSRSLRSASARSASARRRASSSRRMESARALAAAVLSAPVPGTVAGGRLRQAPIASGIRARAAAWRSFICGISCPVGTRRGRVGPREGIRWGDAPPRARGWRRRRAAGQWRRPVRSRAAAPAASVPARRRSPARRG